MQDEQLKYIKQERILLYWEILGCHKVNPETCICFMEYVFDIKKPRIMRIIKGYEKHVKTELPHRELDVLMIESFVKKLFKEARKERTQQTILEI